MALTLLAAAWLAASLPALAEEHPGRAVFDAAGCRSCHRVGPVGGSSGPDLSFAGFRRGREWLEAWLENPRAWKAAALMPDFKLSPASRRVLAEFLASRRGQDLPVRPWNAPELAASPERRGRVLYDRAGCVACHGPAGRGGHPNNNVPGGRIPGLDHAAEAFSRAELVDKIRRGVPRPEPADPAAPAPRAFMPAWGEVLDAGELDAVAAYVLTLGRGGVARNDW